jgi:hypothetical protein
LNQIHTHAGRIKSDSLEGGFSDHRTQRFLRQVPTIDIRNVRTENEGRFLTSRDFLQMPSLPDRQLHRIGARTHDGFYRTLHVLNSLKKAGLVEKTVIDGYVKAAARFGIEKTIETIWLHKIP